MVYDAVRRRHEILHFDITKVLRYRQNYQNCSNLHNGAIPLLLTKRYFILVLISDINAYNDGRGGAAPQARNFVFKFFLLVSSHSKFLDEFQLLFTEWHRRFLNSTPVLCTDRHRGDILRFEITEPTEPLIFISLVNLSLSLDQDIGTEVPILIGMKLVTDRQTDTQTDSLTRYWQTQVPMWRERKRNIHQKRTYLCALFYSLI